MSDFSRLWSTTRPWLHLLPDEMDAAYLRTSAPIQPAVVVEFDGASMRSVDGMFSAFVREFKFPEYFGWNWPAYAECLGDLEWLPARAYLVTIRNPELLLDESPADRETFYRITNGVCSRWANSFALGPEWGGGEVPFNVALLRGESIGEEVSRTVGIYL